MMLNTTILDAPRAALRASRGRLQEAAAALERGQAAHAAVQDRIRLLEDEDSRRASAYAAEVERAAADGTLPVPYLEVPAADAAERHRVQIEARGAGEALERLKAAHAAAQGNLAAAEQALRAAVDQVLDVRARELMQAAEDRLLALQEIGAELASLMSDGRFENAAGLPSEPAARELLKRLPTAQVSDFDVPINELRSGGPRTSRLAELRAELMAGEIEKIESVAA